MHQQRDREGGPFHASDPSAPAVVRAISSIGSMRRVLTISTALLVIAFAIGAQTMRSAPRSNAPNREASVFAATLASQKPAKSGYWMVAGNGAVYGFGTATQYPARSSSAVAIASTSTGSGSWVVTRAGQVIAYGSAGNFGGSPALEPFEAITTIAPTKTNHGYWLFSNRGRVFSYGDARPHGDLSHMHLNGPIVASAATPTDAGYYMVGSDGGVFAFGDAHFHGSMGGTPLTAPIVGLAPTPNNRGYWEVGADGGVFSFHAPFRGSMGGEHLNQPIEGLVAFGNGYLMVASDGGVFDFSNRPFRGSLSGHALAAPIVGIASFSQSSPGSTPPPSSSSTTSAPGSSTTIRGSTTTTTRRTTTTTARATTTTTRAPTTTTTVPPLTGFPTQSDTGVPAGTVLTRYSGPNPITADGTVIDGVDFGTDTTVSINADNVTIRDSRMGMISNHGTGLKVSYSTVTASSCNGTEAVGYDNYSLDHVLVINHSDGPRVSGNNVSITNSYILACFNAGDHADGIQGYGGGTNVVIDHNTIDSTNRRSANSAIFFADHSEQATITDNYLAGGQYVLQPLTETDGTGTYTVTGNVIVNNSWDYGPCRVTADASVSWSANFLDTGKAIPESSC